MPRAHRVRFTAPRRRVDTRRDRAVKVLEGVASYRHSLAGRAVRAEDIAEQRQRQDGLCHNCGQALSLSNAKFTSRTFAAGETNFVVHKHCPKE